MCSNDNDTSSDNDNSNRGRKVTIYCAYSCAKHIYFSGKESTLEMKAMGGKKHTTKIIIIKFQDRKKTKKSRLLNLERQKLYGVLINVCKTLKNFAKLHIKILLEEFTLKHKIIK